MCNLKNTHHVDVIRAVDGLKLLIELPCNWTKQVHYFNGWNSNHYVNQIFMLTVDGEIRIAVVDAPGCFYDLTIADYSAYNNFKFCIIYIWLKL